jgi:dTDP-4-dehydrorhamnose 3,5-epimerase
METGSGIETIPLQIADSLALIIETKIDDRGSLSRIWDKGIHSGTSDLKQVSSVKNPSSGTLRGLHYQSDEFSENKVIQCISGKAFDVLVDLRKNSPTYKMHIELEIGPECAYQGIFIPSGCAHGYLTLEPNTNFIYFMDQVYSHAHTKGILWNDSKLAINWPKNPALISKQDLQWPELRHE